MKKALLSIAVVFSAFFAQAQRNIDWSVDQIISPTQIEHGQTIMVQIVAKNNGADTALPGDSMFSRIFLNNGQLVSQWQIKVLADTLVPGDTIHHVMSFAAVNITGLSFNSSFIAQSVLQNRPGLAIEPQGTAANNSRSITIPYINDKGWGVSVENVIAGTASIHPNPASDMLNVEVRMINAENTVLTMIDMNGKVVYSKNGTDNDNGFVVDLKNFNKGIYLVRISNGDFVSTSKVTVK